MAKHLSEGTSTELVATGATRRLAVERGRSPRRLAAEQSRTLTTAQTVAQLLVARNVAPMEFTRATAPKTTRSLWRQLFTRANGDREIIAAGWPVQDTQHGYYLGFATYGHLILEASGSLVALESKQVPGKLPDYQQLVLPDDQPTTVHPDYRLAAHCPSQLQAERDVQSALAKLVHKSGLHVEA